MQELRLGRKSWQGFRTATTVMAPRVSLAELSAAGISLHAAEAAAIVIEVCRQYSRGELHGIPSAHVIGLTPDGTLLAEGPITTDRPPVAKAAQLLDDLLPPFGSHPSYRVPGGLRLILSRATGTLDLPPFGSLDDFCTALARFAAPDLGSAARSLYEAWECSRAPRTLTISDLRRARRATGLSLEDIASVSGVSAERLRELEWGYFKHWRNDAVGRGWLSGYAKASGLDEQLVTSVVVPMLEKDEKPDARSQAALVPSGPQDSIPMPAAAKPSRMPALWALAAAAALVLLAVATTAVWPRPAIQERADALAPAVVPEFDTRAPALDAHLVPAGQTRPVLPRAAVVPHPAKPHTAVKRASTSSSSGKPSKPNFFKRPLLRIVFK